MNRMKKAIFLCALGIAVGVLAVFGAVNLRIRALANSAVTAPEVFWNHKDASYQLGTEQNPFTVLEIVPNESMAEAGYLISGCEPVDMGKLSVNDYVSTYESKFCGSNPVASTSVITRTVFTDEIVVGETVNTVYRGADGNEAMLVDGVIQDGGKQYGVWYVSNDPITMEGYYERVADDTGRFDLNSKASGYQFSYVGKTGGDYNWVTTPNINKVPSDYLALQVWTNRTEKYSYTMKRKEITHNNDLMLKLFGESADGVITQVVVVPADSFYNTENISLIEGADLIYIHGGHDRGLQEMWKELNKDGKKLTTEDEKKTDFTRNDLPWKAAVALVQRMATDGRAALILDGAAMYSKTPETNNMHKLYIMLMQYGPGIFNQQFIETGKVTPKLVNGVYTGAYQSTSDKGQITEWNQTTFVPSHMTEKQLMAYGVMNPYITDHWNIIEDGIFAYNDDSTMLNQFLVAGIAEHSKNSEAFDYYKDYYGTQTNQISPCEVIRYLLLDHQYKKSLKILEIEPCNEFIYGNDGWELYYQSMFPWFTGDIVNDISVTTMPTWEFIGSIEDINSEYDMILIGGKQNASNGADGYYDSKLNTRWENNVRVGLAYISVGDYVQTYYQNGWQTVKSDENLRYSGNDITMKKVEELKLFINSGKPVVFDSSLFSGNRVNNSVVDKSSNMYNFASLYGTQNGKVLTGNLFVRGQYTNAALKAAMSVEQCKIEFDTSDGGRGYPTEYSYQGNDDNPLKGVQYNSSRTFTYHFSIDGKSGKTYGVRLYIDLNGDGRYEGSLKELDDLSQENLLHTERIYNLTIMDADGYTVEDNQLEPGVVYTVSRELPDSFQGILPWKLEVYDVNNSHSRNNVIDYSVLKTNSETRQEIKVLQMNLTPNMTEEAPEYWTNGWKTGFIDMSQDIKFQKYLSCVDEYKVSIEFLRNREWNKAFGEQALGYSGNENEQKEAKIEAWKEYLDQYDMLILGFNDMSTFTNSEVYYAGFQYFVDQGKSLILSHDVVKDATFVQTNPKFFSVFDTQLRDLMGQRRYSGNTVELNGEQVSLLRKDGKYQKEKDGLVLPEYFDNSTRLYLSFGSQTKADRDTFMERDGWGSNNLTEYVNLLNQGQITNYPYKLNSLIQISSTHTQNYQLNMENEDMIVWYGLTDVYSKKYSDEIKRILGSRSYNSNVTPDKLGRGVYSSIEGDGRNSYYIYNKGNITYTGLGHNRNGNTNLPDDEVKLFVNTMISAYRAAASRPKVVITNDDAITNGNENILYVPMDEVNFSNRNTLIPVYFKIADDSLVDVDDRTYTLQYKGENGQLIDQVIFQSNHKTVEGNSGEGFQISKETVYYFNVPYEQVRNNGSVEYYLILNSSYVNSKNETITTTSRTKVTVLPMPLFNLN